MNSAPPQGHGEELAPPRAPLPADPSGASPLADYILENATVCIAVLSGAELRYTLANRTYRALAPVDDVVGRTFTEVFSDADPARLENFRRVLATGERWQVDRWHAPLTRRPDATFRGHVTRLPSRPGEPASILIMAQDITEAARAESALQVSREWLRRVLEASPFGAAVGDADGRVVFANDCALRLVGLSRDVLERGEIRWDRATPPEYLEADRRAAAQAFERGVSEFYEKEFERPDGSRTPVEIACASLGYGELAAFFLDVTARKRGEAALRSSEQRYRRLFENMAEGFALVEIVPDAASDGDRYRYLAINEAFERMSGHDRAAVVGRSMREVHPTLDPNWYAVLEEVARTGVARRVERSTNSLGRVFSAVVFSPGPGQLAAVFEDVTEMKRAEDALRESEARFRSVLDASRDVIFRLNLQTGRCEYVSPSVKRMFGMAPDEVAGRDTEQLLQNVHPDDRDAVRGALARAEQAGEAEVEFRHVTATGDCRRISNQILVIRDDAGRPLYRDGTFRDVNERTRAAEALRESESRFRELAAAAPQMVFELGPQGEPAYFNARWSEYTGRAPGDVAYRARLVHPDDRERMLSSWARAVETRSPWECEYRFRRRDGQYRWVLSRATPILDARGRIKRWFGTATDVHDIKRAQEALRDVDRRRNEFLAMLSHELRNPLAPLKNSLYVLEHATPGGEQANRAKAVIGRQVAQLSRLIDDLLDVTRVSRNKLVLQLEELDLGDHVRRVVEDQRSLFERSGVRLEVRAPEEPITVRGDPARLGQVVTNLLQNAVKFTERGGRTRVTVEREPDGGRAVIRVRDTGVGMTPETIGRLFQQFVQADEDRDRRKGGLGLGLALVKGLVELHGGEVSANSDGPGTGSELVVWLPVAERDERGVRRASAWRPAAAPRRVLVIDDDVDAAESLRDALELSGHAVDVAHSGPEGLGRARAFKPEVVLCDIGLQGMDGYEVARAFRADAELKDAHLAAVSGHGTADAIRRARDAGFERHLLKPASVEVLDQILQELVAH